jgi:ATP/maltotriose-dependent transcriptional regulator MalT
LFIIALDDQGQWFRYHHLLQEYLQHELENDFPSAEIATVLEDS